MARSQFSEEDLHHSALPTMSWLFNIPFGWQWTAGTVVTAVVTLLSVRRVWSVRRLDRKLEKKRELCRKSVRQIEQEVEERNLPAPERDAIVSLPLSALQTKLQSGELKADDVLRAYQHKALELNGQLNCVVEFITEAKVCVRIIVSILFV
ncbi:vitamin D3 hydroxylase-associated protein-like [Babylonia areolata]|uniref:vitamin D3 hydroxylase-associated protein-like n=1 Tax=Babylonia areolata TaxID=304850 RepID=UPI003FD2B178